MLQADYGWLFARIARMPETRSTTLAHLPAGTYATSTRASRQGLSCKGGRFHASDDYVYYELGSATPMSTLRFIPVLLIAGAVGASETVAQNPVPSVAPCLHYEPHVVRVTGKLVTEPHYGPPNFGETPDEDQKLAVLVLLLSHAVDVCGNPASATDQDT